VPIVDGEGIAAAVMLDSPFEYPAGLVHRAQLLRICGARGIRRSSLDARS